MTWPRPSGRRAVVAAALAAITALSAACGSETGAVQDAGAGGGPDPADWDSVLAAAEGQTVNWYMYGGSPEINDYVTGYVAERAAEEGVTLEQVPINDTVEAVNRVLGEKQAGRNEDGSVDLIWVNGENFATGVQADLWYCGWPEQIPSAELIDFDDPAVANDFGVPVDGCEAAWFRAASGLVYNSDALDLEDTASVDALFAWAQDNPGRYTYPAPPDFTGSMSLRTFFYDAAGGYEDLLGDFDQGTYDAVAPELWERLNALEPSLWRGGDTYPQSGSDIAQLYGSGEIDAFLTYDTATVPLAVADGTFFESTRTAVFEDGNIANISFLGIPYNAADKAGAMVVANILQSAEAQLELRTALGFAPAIEIDRTGELQAEFAAIPVAPSTLSDQEFAEASLPEVQASWVTEIEDGWTENVLQQ
jgi:putative spermidine/putrescine transport system substrate-binding protein